MKYYQVSFQYSATVFCSNMAISADIEAVKNHYSKYEWYNISEATAADIETAKRKGMPIIEL